MKHHEITKKQADTLYRATKENTITLLPETVKAVYGMVNENQSELAAMTRYQRDTSKYARIHRAVDAIINGNGAEAQRIMNAWERDAIKNAGKKSVFSKYQENLKEKIANEKQIGDIVNIEGEWLAIQSAEFAAENGTQWNEDEHWIYFDSNNDDEAPFVVKK